MQKKSYVRYYVLAVVSLILLVALDQWTKLLAVSRLMEGPFVLIPDVFEFHYLENRGTAFGMLQNKQYFLLTVTILVLAMICVYFVKLPWTKKMNWLRVIAVFIVAGGIGNMIDRIRLGYVIDFFYFKLINFPIFNVADIYVTVSLAILFFLIIFVFKEDELDAFLLFAKKKKDE